MRKFATVFAVIMGITGIASTQARADAMAAPSTTIIKEAAIKQMAAIRTKIIRAEVIETIPGSIAKDQSIAGIAIA